MQMKGTLGGYGYGGDIYGPYELPEVTITCGQSSGKCWKCYYVMSGEFTGECKGWTGNQNDSCSAYRNCNSF